MLSRKRCSANTQTPQQRVRCRRPAGKNESSGSGPSGSNICTVNGFARLISNRNRVAFGLVAERLREQRTRDLAQVTILSVDIYFTSVQTLHSIAFAKRTGGRNVALCLWLSSGKIMLVSDKKKPLLWVCVVFFKP